MENARMNFMRILKGLGLGLAALGATASTATSAEDKVQYNRDIRPILAENCFRCHGPDSASRKADLRLDKRDSALELEAIIPRDPGASELVNRVETTDRDQLMPPPKSGKSLTAAQTALLKRWITEGAEYQPHWSFIAPSRPSLPAVKDSSWSKNPIDRFVLASLEHNGLKPAPEADRRTLARRLSLDLTGLPPETAEVEAFVADKSPDAYEKLVDKYLASPRWGEHRGRYWLDAARYADTHGIHIDNFREMWSYREWVINALNKNMPFDQFTIEQLAGDLLPNKTLDQQIASGFNRCNITTSEGGAIDEEYYVLYTRDRIETVSQVYMGLTAGCAVCHDHKFDPLSQKEFYEMSAFFNNTTQAAMDGNIQDTPPKVFVPAVNDRVRWAAISTETSTAKASLDARRKVARGEFDKFLASSTPQSLAATIPAKDQKFHAALDSRDATTVPTRSSAATLELADVGDFDREQAFSYGAWIKLTKPGISGAILARMDDQHDFRGWDLWLEGNKVGAHIVHKWPENALKAIATPEIPVNTWTHVFVSYDGSSKASGIKVFIDGKPQPTTVSSDTLKATIRAQVPLKVGQRHSTSRTINSTLIHDLRTYGRALAEDEVQTLVGASRSVDLAEKPVAARAGSEVEAVFSWWVDKFDAPAREIRGRLTKLEAEEAAIKSRGTVALVMNEKPQPPMAFLLFRGEYDKRRDQVKANTPAVLPPLPSDAPRNRLGFAQWLLRPEHPLTARVTVNRFWQELFGTGLVRTTGDFGVSGELPSHPELLDWLAVEFRDGGWDIKKFFKLLVTSAAYRQSEDTTPEKREKDPDNRLISHGPRYRMDAEMVRDYALAASGLLVAKIGGPSVKPYQPDGVWEAVAMIGSNTRDYRRDSGDSLYRRSLYTFWKRSAPPASMDIFNAPSREVCAVRRERTNTPLQALVTLNDVQFVEAARVLAERSLKEAGDSIDRRLDFIVKRLLSRGLRPDEAKIVRSSLDDLLVHYKSHPEAAKKLLSVGETRSDPKLDASSLAAWTMVTNELMNLDEVLNK
jgi:mono/diheme cytochrome c family protein